jgi:hypothetical protein
LRLFRRVVVGCLIADVRLSRDVPLIFGCVASPFKVGRVFFRFVLDGVRLRPCLLAGPVTFGDGMRVDCSICGMLGFGFDNAAYCVCSLGCCCMGELDGRWMRLLRVVFIECVAVVVAIWEFNVLSLSRHLIWT